MDNLGGMQRVAMELDAAFRGRPDLDYQTEFLRAPWKTVHIRSIPFLLRLIPTLFFRARRGDLGIVVFSSMVTAALTVVLAPVFRRHEVFSAAIVHGLDVTTPSPIYQRFVPRVFRSLDLVMPVSASTGRECVARGLSPDKLRPVRNGVDLRRFQIPVHTPLDRRSLLAQGFEEARALGDHDVVLCSVGRQVKRKGFEWFVRHVMPSLPNNVHYWLAGSGPETESIRQAISQTRLDHRVRLLGRVEESQLHALYRGADLFVMPNVAVPGDVEGFGVVMLESGMNGMPTVGACLEGIAEVIEPGENGLLVESEDAQGFVDAIGQLTHDLDTRQAASRQAYAYTRDTFSWQSVCAEYLEVIAERRGVGR